MIGFANTVPNRTRTEIQIIADIKPTYTLALPRNTKHMAIDGQVCFHIWLFANPIKPLRYTTGFVEPVNGFNKDMSGARLLPMTVLTYLVVKLIILEILNVQFGMVFINPVTIDDNMKATVQLLRKN